MSTSLSTRNLYTIGWICALPLERAAATAMLEVQHAQPRDFTQPRSDTNSYTWGSISAHNVVIASLPAGEYGLGSAANVVTAMLSSFSEVRFGLLVGIGAGIPRPGRDIRLGDIVVSQPHGRSGGVVQYDFVRAIQGKVLDRMGFLNSPPRVLLNAVSAIKAQHELQPSHIPQFLTEMITRFPNMAQEGMHGYKYQGSRNDRLFKAKYPHIAGDECSNCDPTQQERRAERPFSLPRIHYGVIASGNTLVKDATVRTSLVQQTGEDCICFEMEAAGLMNEFPCLVIRGICDYADSHKNDRWQRYAAGVAAAYARELVEYLPVQDVKATQTASETVTQGSPSTADNNEDLTQDLKYEYGVDNKLMRPSFSFTVSTRPFHSGRILTARSHVFQVPGSGPLLVNRAEVAVFVNLPSAEGFYVRALLLGRPPDSRFPSIDAADGQAWSELSRYFSGEVVTADWQVGSWQWSIMAVASEFIVLGDLLLTEHSNRRVVLMKSGLPEGISREMTLLIICGAVRGVKDITVVSCARLETRRSLDLP